MLNVFTTLLTTNVNLFTCVCVAARVPRPRGFTLTRGAAICCTSNAARVNDCTRRGHRVVSYTMLPSCINGTVITSRSHSFCAGGNVSLCNVTQTLCAGLAANDHRNNSAVARRCTRHCCLNRAASCSNGLERTFLTVGVTRTRSGDRILYGCVGAVCLNHNTCNVRTTTGTCFGGGTDSLALSRTTVLTNVVPTPDS